MCPENQSLPASKVKPHLMKCTDEKTQINTFKCDRVYMNDDPAAMFAAGLRQNIANSNEEVMPIS